MNRRRVAAAFAGALAALSPCGRAQDPQQTQAAIDRTQRELQQVRADTEALLDARIRNDLGLPIGSDLECLRGDAPPSTSQALERATNQLTTEDGTTAALLARYEKLRRQVEQVRAEQAQRAAKHSEEEWVTVPAPGAGAATATNDAGQVDTRSTAAPPKVAPEEPAASAPSQPAGETVPVGERPFEATGARVVLNVDPIKAQIDGTGDRGIVAQALYKAAQALVDRATELQAQGQTDAANTAYDEARQRLQRAADELGPLCDPKTGAFADLFHFGKVREQLFRISERRDGMSLRKDAREYQRREQEVRDVFVAITARDIVTRAGTEQLGNWGRAAQSALDHFRWMNLHSGYAPKTDPKSITWTGEKR